MTVQMVLDAAEINWTDLTGAMTLLECGDDLPGLVFLQAIARKPLVRSGRRLTIRLALIILRDTLARL